MRRQIAIMVALWLTTSILHAVNGTQMFLIARDVEDHPLSGFHFSYGGIESQATDQTGATELSLPPGAEPGQQIKLLLVHSKKTKDWFLVNSQVNIPMGSAFAEMVLMRRSAFRLIADEALDAPKAKPHRSDEWPTAEDQKEALLAAAAHHGLTAEQLASAIRSFSETQDPKDRGIAAYLKGQYQQAEKLLKRAARKKKSDLVETLRYLGSSQYKQAEYREAANSFRIALTLRSEDTSLLGLLGKALDELAEWREAEHLKRRALEIDEKNCGKNHPRVATDLNNLAVLLKEMNRIVEAKSLMRRALKIDENNYGKGHPKVARDLSNLAMLLQDKSLAEAEPLMRRALKIDERNYGKGHPTVARDLSTLAMLLQDKSRLAEAEPLMRCALKIDERNYGKGHPTVAEDLSDLAMLLQVKNRLTEAEPLMRRALKIDEKHYGEGHPRVATDLNKLAMLLQAKSRIAEAEPMMRRALAIFLDFSRRTGFGHPNEEAAVENYRHLLRFMGKTKGEIEEALKTVKQNTLKK